MKCGDNASSAADGSAPASPSASDFDFLQLGLRHSTTPSSSPPPPPPMQQHASLRIWPYPSKPAPFISEFRAQEQDKEKFDGDHAQLTIFYAGAVHVYDKVSSHKAQAIMLLVSSQQKSDLIANKQSPSLIPINMQDMSQTIKRRSHRELPFARKASFARFLKTRKARVQEAIILKATMEQEALQKASDL